MIKTFEGNLTDEGTYVSSWDLVVTIEGDDAWTVAGGAAVGEPWLVLVEGATVYQAPMFGNDVQPMPAFFVVFPDLEWDSFYTTHLGWPNTTGDPPPQGVLPGFAFGPEDTATELNADWFWTPDQNFYPGTFTIARATVIPESPWRGVVDVQVGSLDTPPELYHFIIPEPASLALLALGGLALLRRR